MLGMEKNIFWDRYTTGGGGICDYKEEEGSNGDATTVYDLVPGRLVER
jgi:hypothetical protein